MFLLELRAVIRIQGQTPPERYFLDVVVGLGTQKRFDIATILGLLIFIVVELSYFL